MLHILNFAHHHWFPDTAVLCNQPALYKTSLSPLLLHNTQNFKHIKLKIIKTCIIISFEVSKTILT